MHALAPVAALLIGVAILLAGNGLQGTLLPVRASMEDFSTISIGAIGGAYFLGFTLGCMKGGELVQRAGHVRTFAAMTALASAAPLVHGLVLNPVAWGGLRIISGFCFAVLFVVIESWLNELSDNDNRGTVFSTYVMITLTFLAAGQLTFLLYDPVEMHSFAIASVLVSIAAVPVVMSTAPTPQEPTSVEIDLRRLFRISQAGAMGCFATGLTNGSFWALAPLFIAGFTDNISAAAWLMSAGVAGGAISQWPLGLLSDRLGRRQVLVLVAMLGVAVAAVIVFMSGSLPIAGILLLGAAWGAVAFPLYSISVAYTNDYADASEYVMVSSGLLLMYGAGAIIGPFAASAVMTIAGASGLFLFTGIAHLLLLVFTLLRITIRDSAPEDQHIAFSDAFASAYTASHVYEEEVQGNIDDEIEPNQESVP